MQCDTAVEQPAGRVCSEHRRRWQQSSLFADSHRSSFRANTTPVVELVVPTRQAVVESQAVRELVVFGESEARYWIPVSPDDDPVGETNRYETDDVVEYAQSLGHVPQNGV